MNTPYIIYHMLRADFLERTRRSSFLFTLALAVLIGFIFLPPTDATNLMFALGPWRGLYNSAWIGSVYGILFAIFMPLLGFFLTKNTIERDRRTRVGQILATTPMSKPVYVLGKWLSNLAVMAAMLVIINLMAVFMQWLRGEVPQYDLLALSVPIWAIGLPLIALTAALAVLFETIPLLSASAGNVIYFILWYILMDNVALPGLFRYSIGDIVPWADPLGVTHVLAAMQAVGNQVRPDFHGFINFGGADFGVVPQVANFSGIAWTADILSGRLLWLGIAALLGLAAALPFDRFDPARASNPEGKPSSIGAWLRSLLPRRKENLQTEPAFALAGKVILTPITRRVHSSRFLSLLRAELKLMVQGKPWWWYVVAVLVSLLGLGGPPGGGGITFALALIWPVIAWSSLGMRETFFDTYKITYSASSPFRRQFMASWLSGVSLAMLAVSGATLRMLLQGHAERLPVIFVATLFIPTLAMALGTWSNSSRLFEVIYLPWLFMGANGVTPFDFLQTHQTTPNLALLAAYLCLTILLFGLSLAGRWRQIHAS